MSNRYHEDTDGRVHDALAVSRILADPVKMGDHSLVSVVVASELRTQEAERAVGDVLRFNEEPGDRLLSVITYSSSGNGPSIYDALSGLSIPVVGPSVVVLSVQFTGDGRDWVNALLDDLATALGELTVTPTRIVLILEYR